MNLHQLRLQPDHVLGNNTEHRFFCAMQAPNLSAPRWFHDLRRATDREDMRGIDAFATIDLGEVPIQIKSTIWGLQRHQEKHRDEHCIIVVDRKLTAREIRDKTFRFLYFWRGKLIRARKSR